MQPRFGLPAGLQPGRDRTAKMGVHPADDVQLEIHSFRPQPVAHVQQERLVLAWLDDPDA